MGYMIAITGYCYKLVVISNNVIDIITLIFVKVLRLSHHQNLFSTLKLEIGNWPLKFVVLISNIGSSLITGWDVWLPGYKDTTGSFIFI